MVAILMVHMLQAITRDTGAVSTFKAFRVQHNCSRGPYKGGT